MKVTNLKCMTNTQCRQSLGGGGVRSQPASSSCAGGGPEDILGEASLSQACISSEVQAADPPPPCGGAQPSAAARSPELFGAALIASQRCDGWGRSSCSKGLLAAGQGACQPPPWPHQAAVVMASVISVSSCNVAAMR
jgi:hypothetical protein